MPLFKNIDDSKEDKPSCFERTTQRVKSLAKYMGQAFYQGFLAPYYSFTSFKASWNAYPPLQNTIKSSAKLNGVYALKALGLYTSYYRGFQLLNYLASNSHFSKMFLKAINPLYYLTMNSYLLLYEMPFILLQNKLDTDTIANYAKDVVGDSEIKSCGCFDAFASPHSTFFYAANRYGVNTISYYLNPVTAFLLESLSFGYPLVEYKLNAVETCTKHRFQELFLNNKAYLIFFGASFVSVMWFVDYLSNNISGCKKNIFFYDALFSFLFQVYAMISISRKERFPGGREQHIDILAFLKYLSETRLPQYIFQLLKKRYSLESIAQSEGVGMWVLQRENQIQLWLKTCKGYLEMIEKLLGNQWLEWIIKPFFVIPSSVKSYKDFIRSRITDSEKYIELARDTEYRRAILQTISTDAEKKNENDEKKPDALVLRETDSDDEWEDNFVEVLRGKATKEEKPQPLNSEFNDQHFICKKEVPPSIQNDPWFVVDSNKPLTRSASHLFRKRTPLTEKTKKILKEAVKQKKGVDGLTGMLIAAHRL